MEKMMYFLLGLLVVIGIATFWVVRNKRRQMAAESHQQRQMLVMQEMAIKQAEKSAAGVGITQSHESARRRRRRQTA